MTQEAMRQFAELQAEARDAEVSEVEEDGEEEKRQYIN
jgi:hypothetical protein